MGKDWIERYGAIKYYQLDIILKKFTVITREIFDTSDIAFQADRDLIASIEFYDALQSEIISMLNTILPVSMHYGLRVTNPDTEEALVFAVGDIIDKLVLTFDDFILSRDDLYEENKLELIEQMHMKSIPLRVEYEQYDPHIKEKILPEEEV